MCEGEECESGDGCVNGDSVMETDADKPRFSKRYLEKLSKAWKGRRDKRKRKRLSHTRKDKW